MKTISFNLTALFLLVSIFSFSCEKESIKVTPSNQVTSQNHQITTFDQLSISDLFQAYIEFSDSEQSLRIEANDNLHRLIEVEQINGKLSIQLDDDIRNINGSPVLKIYLTTNDFEEIEAHGACKVFFDSPWTTSQATIDLTGASSLDGTIITTGLTANLTGACNMNIDGSAQLFDIEAEGASHMEGFGFETQDLKADLTGASSVTVTVHGSLEVKATGASTVYYQGDGVISEQELSGGSSIIRN